MLSDKTILIMQKGSARNGSPLLHVLTINIIFDYWLSVRRC